MYGFPGRDHLLFDDDVVEPVDSDQTLALPQSLLGGGAVLGLAHDVRQPRVVGVLHLAAILPDDPLPVADVDRLFRIVGVITNVEDATQQAPVGGNWKKIKIKRNLKK